MVGDLVSSFLICYNILTITNETKVSRFRLETLQKRVQRCQSDIHTADSKTRCKCMAKNINDQKTYNSTPKNQHRKQKDEEQNPQKVVINLLK